ncbi:hypothetical protein [Rhodobium gokarnense]|uniref:Acetate kinase n=1 Tax=Rhodobium gokarnense TaxID=364296 RepID=A0ABT3HB54_9HYPH|nr:hypothetical protein [Rhodobium gokarnense]MCW2307632.1 acetate kinase [Rhodobium gokarnense]
MRVLLESDRPEAREAVDLFCYHVAKETGALSSALAGLDALVFTAGIGEHSAPVRSRICGYLGFPGITPNEVANERGDAAIAASGSLPVHIIVTNGEVLIARHAVNLPDVKSAA